MFVNEAGKIAGSQGAIVVCYKDGEQWSLEGVPKTASSSSSSPVESISNKHLTLTPAQRFEVGNRAAEHDITTVLKTACENTSMRTRSGIVLICA